MTVTEHPHNARVPASIQLPKTGVHVAPCIDEFVYLLDEMRNLLYTNVYVVVRVLGIVHW